MQILYLPGLKNVVADFLSRPNQITAGSVAAASATDPVDFEEMAAEQNRCPETQRLQGGTSPKLAFHQTGAQRLAGDVSTGNFRPLVPLKFRKNIFDHFHDVAHPGRLASRRIIFSRFVWRGLSSDVTAWARGCLPASGARSTATQAWSPSPSPSRNGVFLIDMLIWWAHCSTVIILIIFLPLLIARPSGSHPPFRNAAATWSKELPFVLLRLRAQPREDTGLSPAEAVFGAQIVFLNLNFFFQND